MHLLTYSFDEKHIAKNAREITETRPDVIEAKAKVVRLRRWFGRCDSDRRKALKGKSKLWHGYAEVERKWEVHRAKIKAELQAARQELRDVRKRAHAEELRDQWRRWRAAIRWENDILDPPTMRDWRAEAVEPVFKRGVTAEEAMRTAATATAHARATKWSKTHWAKIHVGGPDWRAPTPYLATKYRDRAHAWLPSGDYIPARKAAKRHKPRVRRDIDAD
jgi:phage-related tail protein